MKDDKKTFFTSITSLLQSSSMSGRELWYSFSILVIRSEELGGDRKLPCSGE